MVKRQTVWLSTMMVLSLMLIGYYTMNNETSTTTTSNSTSVATTTVPSSTNSTGGSTNNAASGSTDNNTTSSNATHSTSATQTSSSDWYVNMQTTLDTQMAKEIDTERAVLANNNSSSDQLAQAEQKLRTLQAEQGGLQSAKDMVVGMGYQDCVIVPNSDNTKVIVYVKANKLSQTQAVQIMNKVSQELNLSAANVVVQMKQ